MEYDLGRGVFALPKPFPDYRAVAWRDKLLESHAETKYQSFRFEIDANVFPCLGNRDGCYRLMREIARRDTFLPDSTILLSHVDPLTQTTEPCGTIQAISDNMNRGSIQNIGVVPGYRGLGLGTLLIYHALKGFASTGLASATLEVTAQNTKALRLYHRLGFKITRTVFKAVEVAFASS